MVAFIKNLEQYFLDYLIVIFGTFLGAVFGVFMTFFVMSTLVMLSVSGIFNIYYGGLLAFLGGMMVVKICRKNKIIELDGADSTGTRMSIRSIERLDHNAPSNA